MSTTTQGMLGDYVQNSVEAEGPVEMVCLLYAKAIERIKAAREHLSRGEISERAQAIALASQIVLELQSSLDAERGGEVAANLDRLYSFMQEQLAEANAKQTVEPLNVTLQLLETLYEGWQECRAQSPAAPPHKTPEPTKPAPAAPQLDDPHFDPVGAGSESGRAWTL